MEFPIEGILETLLVGAIVSLLLLSFLFFFFGHVLRIEPVRRFFAFLLTDDRHLHEPADDPEARDKPAARDHARRSGGAEKAPPEPSHHMNFILLTLLAVLYGLGVISESVSHRLMSEADDDVKISSFQHVADGQLKSGRNDVQLAQLLADFYGCRARSLFDKHRSMPCRQIHDRIIEFFHNAKNLVFQNESYHGELASLESRTTFARSLFGALCCLAVELLLVIFAASISENLYVWYQRHPRRPLSRFARKRARWIKDLAIHWVNLAAVRCIWIFLAVVGFTGLAWIARGEADKQFDMRVFGYAISLEDARRGERQPENQAPAKTEGHEEREANRPSEQAASGAKSVMPRSPYIVFGLENGKQFEPSAVAAVRGSSHVIVVNDKGGRDAFLLFDLQGADELRNPLPIQEKGAAFADLGRIESLYARVPSARELGPVDGGLRPGLVELFAATTFVSTPNRPLASRDAKIVSFLVDSDATPPATVTEAMELDLDHHSPCERLGKSCEVEGITLRTVKDEAGQTVEQLLLGVKKVDGVPAVAIVGFEHHENKWTNPTVLFRPAKGVLDDGCGNRSGVSDLTDGPGESIYMLTSIELAKSERGCGAGGTGGPGGAGQVDAAPKLALSEVSQVGGALWYLPAKLLRNSGDGGSPIKKLSPIQEFAHKPEGVADLADGAMLVVFDDEGHRKSRTWAPDTFALNQNESVFAVVKAEALRPED